MFKKFTYALAMAAFIVPGTAFADGIVNTIVNAPLSATGTVKNARVGVNVYLQNESAPGIDFMDPAVTGFGIPAGGVLEVEMAEGFERDWDCCTFAISYHDGHWRTSAGPSGCKSRICGQ